MKRFKNIIDNIKADLMEYWTLTLIVVGVPLVAYMYADMRLAFAVFVAANIAIGLLTIREGN